MKSHIHSEEVVKFDYSIKSQKEYLEEGYMKGVSWTLQKYFTNADNVESSTLILLLLNKLVQRFQNLLQADVSLPRVF